MKSRHAPEPTANRRPPLRFGWIKPLALACAAIALAAGSNAAQACTIARRPTPPTQAETDRWLQDRYLRAVAVVEVVAETGSTMTVPGRMRVLQVYKGDFSAGMALAARGWPESACGPGDIRAGTHGVILIDRPGEPITFRGYLSDDELSRMRALGLMPAH